MRMMIIAATIAALTGPAAAQASKQDGFEAKRTKKLSKPVFRAAAWHLDYDEARAQAKKQGKFLLTYFTRSYEP